MVVTIKFLNNNNNNNKLSNIMKNKYCILCVKNYLLKIMDDLAVGILRSRNFGRYSMLSIFSKTKFDF